MDTGPASNVVTFKWYKQECPFHCKYTMHHHEDNMSTALLIACDPVQWHMAVFVIYQGGYKYGGGYTNLPLLIRGYTIPTLLMRVVTKSILEVYSMDLYAMLFR